MIPQLRTFSYGGGVQSTAALVLAAQGKIDYPIFLFSNVGDDSELPATLAYVRNVAMPYAEEHSIELRELNKTPKGKERTLYGVLTREDSRSINIPMRMNDTGAPGTRSCTSDFKIRRIAAVLKVMGATKDAPAITGLGISLDEFQRARTDSGIPWQVLEYPLIDMRITRQDCINIISRAGLPVPPKSSCYFCPFHSLTQWRHLKEHEPELFAKSAALETLINERRTRLGRDPMWLTRMLVPLEQAVQGTQHEMDFEETCESGFCMT
jgi:hypothetical protein